METKNALKTQKDYKHTLTVSASAKEATDRIGEVHHWWAKKVKGKSSKLNDEFSVHFGTTFVNFRITEFVPGKKIVWLVTDCYLDWINDKKEWRGTTVIWSLSGKSRKTTIDFLHLGVTPERECYESCNAGWTHHLDDSLLKLIETGKGFPE
jgi:hypothetical protein